MDVKEKNMKVEDDTEAMYKVLTEAYEKRFSIRTWLLKKVLYHMLGKIQEECTIYFLMCKVREYRNRSV